MTFDIPRLHIVTDDSILAGSGFIRAMEEVLLAGGDRVALHLRGRALTGAELWGLARACADVAERTRSAVLINDRLDIALAVDAAGAQLGAVSFPVAAARRLLGPARLIGRSVHTAEAARAAVVAGADFVLAGTLYETPTHPERIGSGVDWLREIPGSRIPLIGIGGITPGRVRAVRRAGAHGVATIRGVWDAERPARMVEQYLAELE